MVDRLLQVFGGRLDGIHQRWVDMGDGAHAPQVAAYLQDDLLTGTTNPRVRVDVAQTSFFEKREFRTFKEWSDPLNTEIPNGQTYVIRAVVGGDIILAGLDITLDNGQVRVETVVGGTPGGSFSETLPIINRNTMAEGPVAPSPNVVLTAGGTHTGGTLLDVLRLKVENQSGAASSVGVAGGDERGVGANTYYFRIVNIGAGVVEGTFHARWEQRAAP